MKIRGLGRVGGKRGVLMVMIKQSTKHDHNRDVAQTKEKSINETKQTMIQVRRVDFES